jgi:hypothetical protein
MLLNTNDIHKIIIEPNKYCINVVSKDINGSGWHIGGTGLSSLYTNAYSIVIDESTEPDDYKKVSEWIDKIDT